MRRVLCCVVGFAAALAPTSLFAIQIDPTPLWTATPAGSSCYYLNDNLDGASVLFGQISFGARQYGVDGNEIHSLSMSGLLPHNDAKCLLRLGDYYYVTDGDGGGIGRFDATGANAWSADSFQSPINPGGTGPESIVTDGTLIYANDDVVRNRVHAYTVGTDPFSLTEAWSVNLPDGGRVRGLTYDVDSGLLYMHNGGVAGSTTFYAVDPDTHTAHAMGSHNEGELVAGGLVYQALRYGNEILVFGTSDNMTAYALSSDTTIGASTSQVNLGVGDIYGAAIYGNTLFVGAGSKITAFAIVPEPGSALLLVLGSASLFCWPWRRRRRGRLQA